MQVTFRTENQHTRYFYPEKRSRQSFMVFRRRFVVELVAHGLIIYGERFTVMYSTTAEGYCIWVTRDAKSFRWCNEAGQRRTVNTAVCGDAFSVQTILLIHISPAPCTCMRVCSPSLCLYDCLYARVLSCASGTESALAPLADLMTAYSALGH